MTIGDQFDVPRTSTLAPPAPFAPSVEMETMSEAVGRLRDAGFVLDFAVGPDERLSCTECGTSVAPVDAAIEQLVRFEGDSNPDDQAILVAAILPCGHRGLLSSAYGPPIDRPTGEALRVMGTGVAVSNHVVGR